MERVEARNETLLDPCNSEIYTIITEAFTLALSMPYYYITLLQTLHGGLDEAIFSSFCFVPQG